MIPKLRFPGFSGEWEDKRLTDVYDKIVVGFVGTISTEYCDAQEGIQFIRTLNVRNGYFDNTTFQYVTKDFHRKNPKSSVQNGDVLIARVGANMGMVCLVSGLTGVANSANVVIIKKQDYRNSGFFAQYLASELGQRQIHARGAGGAQEVFNIGVAKTVSVPVPDYEEQEKIAGFLTAVDERIAAMDKKVELLQQYKKGIMQKIFTQKLTFSNTIWKKRMLKDLVKIPISDGPHLTPTFVSNGIIFLSVDNMQAGEIRLKEPRRISHEDHEEYSKKCRPQNGDILFGKAASVGNVAIANLEEEFNIWSPIAMIRINNDLADTRFVYYTLQTDILKRQIRRYINSSSQENIGMSDINKLLIEVPSIDEQQKIADFLTSLDDKINLEKTKLEQAKLFKKSLLQRMFV